MSLFVAEFALFYCVFSKVVMSYWSVVVSFVVDTSVESERAQYVLGAGG